MGSTGNNDIAPDPTKDYKYSELLELAKKKWTAYYVNIGFSQEQAEKTAEELILKTVNVEKLKNAFSADILGTAPSGKTASGGVKDWNWITTVCESTVCPQGTPLSWTWGILTGSSISIKVGTTGSWNWSTVCCTTCEVSYQCGAGEGDPCGGTCQTNDCSEGLTCETCAYDATCQGVGIDEGCDACETTCQPAECGEVGYCEICHEPGTCEACDQHIVCQTECEHFLCEFCGEDGFCEPFSEIGYCEIPVETGICTDGSCEVCGQIGMEQE